MNPKRKRAIIKKNKRIAQAKIGQMQYERKLQKQNGTEFCGYWQFNLNGYTAAELFSRCKYVGNIDMAKIPINQERRFLISMYIYLPADTAKDRKPLDISDLEVNCTLADLGDIIHHYCKQVGAEHKGVICDTYHSYARVRT
ncbi:hypothetical protein ACFBZI_07485 [Moraxella sp. ZJ142]|uniref:hypothetical protein n=1 Tax=Moraxella marmotae TaxID=3344520 RepID=UPI0035D521BA